MSRARDRDAEAEADDRPPICPACGVTQGMVATDGGTEYVCLECGFSDSGARAGDHELEQF